MRVSAWSCSFHMRISVPRLAQPDVCNAIVVSEGYVKVAVSIKGAAIEANIFPESLELKSAFVDGWFCFARHGNGSRGREAVMLEAKVRVKIDPENCRLAYKYGPYRTDSVYKTYNGVVM